MRACRNNVSSPFFHHCANAAHSLPSTRANYSLYEGGKPSGRPWSHRESTNSKSRTVGRARIRVMSNARGSRSRFTYFKTYINSLNFFNTQRPRCLRGCGQLAAYRVARIASIDVRVTTRGGLEKEIENYAARE